MKAQQPVKSFEDSLKENMNVMGENNSMAAALYLGLVAIAQAIRSLGKRDA